MSHIEPLLNILLHISLLGGGPFISLNSSMSRINFILNETSKKNNLAIEPSSKSEEANGGNKENYFKVFQANQRTTVKKETHKSVLGKYKSCSLSG